MRSTAQHVAALVAYEHLRNSALLLIHRARGKWGGVRKCKMEHAPAERTDGLIAQGLWNVGKIIENGSNAVDGGIHARTADLALTAGFQNCDHCKIREYHCGSNHHDELASQGREYAHLENLHIRGKHIAAAPDRLDVAGVLGVLLDLAAKA